MGPWHLSLWKALGMKLSEAFVGRWHDEKIGEKRQCGFMRLEMLDYRDRLSRKKLEMQAWRLSPSQEVTTGCGRHAYKGRAMRSRLGN